MNNNNKEKTVNPWTLRLFEQSGTSLSSDRRKIYHGHRYYDSTIHKHNPFSLLFSGAKQHQDQHPILLDLQQLFETQPPLTTRLPEDLQQETDSNLASALEPTLVVVNSYDETPDTKTFHLASQTGRNFAYLPGQYLTLTIVIDGQTYKRSYSLASSPTRPGILEITVKRSPQGGIVSNWLNDHLKIGDTLTVKGPFGKFTCVPSLPKILLLAAGSGIVPMMSMLRWLSDRDAATSVQLLLSFRKPEDIIYRDELRLIVARHTNIKLAITLTAENNNESGWADLSGRINEVMLRQTVPDLSERIVYLCGPETFMMDCRKILLNLNLPAENLYCESFNVNKPITKVAKSIRQLNNRPAGIFRINFAKTGKAVATNGQASLLEIAEKSGVAINYECRNGNCGECLVKCLKGKIEMNGQEEIDDIDRKKGWVYACCAYPSSDVVLDI